MFNLILEKFLYGLLILISITIPTLVVIQALQQNAIMTGIVIGVIVICFLVGHFGYKLADLKYRKTNKG